MNRSPEPLAPTTRLLHTADWHLGKRLHDFPLIDVQRDLVASLVALAAELRPDALLVAGDVFDTGQPSVAALEVWAFALTSLAKAGIPVIAISGNHDHAERLGHLGPITQASQVHLRTAVEQVNEPVLIGHTAIYGLPFARPARVRSAFALSSEDRPTFEDADALAYLTERARSHHAEHHADRTPVALAHAFVEGAGSEDEGEDPIVVGGAGAVPSSVFEGFAYTALGHLHAPRSIADGRLRYAGSLYPTSFAEAGHTKSVSLVTVQGDQATVEEHPLVPRRQMRILEHVTFDEALARAEAEPPSIRDAYTLVRVTDREPIDAAIARLRAWYPHAILEQDRGLVVGAGRADATLETLEPRAASLAFFEHRVGRPMTDDEIELLDEALAFEMEVTP